MSQKRARTPYPYESAPPSRLIFENLHVLGRASTRERLHERIDVGDLPVGHHLLAIGRHFVGGLSKLALEAVERHRGLRESRHRAVHGAALSGPAVAGEAADGEIETLALDRVAGGRVLRPRRPIEPAEPERRNNQGDTDNICRFSHTLLLTADRSRRRSAPARRA